MTRIFSALAVISLLLLGGNIYLGLSGGDYNGVSTEFRVGQQQLSSLESQTTADPAEIEAQRADQEKRLGRLREHQATARWHVMLGLLAALVTVLVNSVCITYFIGTGRWCTEVSDTYALDAIFDDQARTLKKTTFPWSLLGITAVLTIAALGAAADPGTLRESTADWVQPHFLFAMGGTAVIAFALYRQYLGIEKNQELIGEMMAAVRTVRIEKGLEVEGSGIETASSLP